MNKDIHATGGLTNCLHDALQGGVFVRYKIAPPNFPEEPSRLHLEADDVQDLKLMHLHCKVTWLFVKERNAHSVAAQHVYCNHEKYHQRPHINTAGNILFL